MYPQKNDQKGLIKKNLQKNVSPHWCLLYLLPACHYHSSALFTWLPTNPDASRYPALWCMKDFFYKTRIDVLWKSTIAFISWELLVHFLLHWWFYSNFKSLLWQCDIGLRPSERKELLSDELHHEPKQERNKDYCDTVAFGCVKRAPVGANANEKRNSY